VLAGRADRRMADDEKSGVGPVLAHQRDAVDRHEASTPSGGEPVPEKGQDDGMAIRPEPAGQRQMQPEIVEYERIAPAIEIAGLSFGQSDDAPVSILRAHWRAKPIEGCDTGGR